MENAVINVSICVTNIPRAEVKAGSNGKMYIGAVVRPKKEKDQFGNNISVVVDYPQEVRKNMEKPVYIGDGRYHDFENENAEPLPNKIVLLKICVSDIPEGAYRNPGNGKTYVNLSVHKRKEKDRDGNDMYVILSRTKEEKEQGVEKVFVGAGRLLDFAGSERVSDMVPAGGVLPWEVGGGNYDKPGADFDDSPDPDNDDLPF